MIGTRCIINQGKNKVDVIENDRYYVPIVDEKEYSYIAETEDIAILLALQIKYQGLNSQFAKNACRMLGIESNWSK